MEEGYLIYIFAIQWKARFSFKIKRKSCLKISSANRKRLGAPGALYHDVARAAKSAIVVHVVPATGAHAEGLEYPLVVVPRQRAPVRDVHDRWGAKWRDRTRRCAACRAPLAVGVLAHRRALPPTPRVR
jgi:hypothetical protein